MLFKYSISCQWPIVGSLDTLHFDAVVTIISLLLLFFSWTVWSRDDSSQMKDIWQLVGSLRKEVWGTWIGDKLLVTLLVKLHWTALIATLYSSILQHCTTSLSWQKKQWRLSKIINLQTGIRTRFTIWNLGNFYILPFLPPPFWIV